MDSIPTSDIEPFEAALASKRPERPDMSSDSRHMAQTTYVFYLNHCHHIRLNRKIFGTLCGNGTHDLNFHFVQPQCRTLDIIFLEMNTHAVPHKVSSPFLASLPTPLPACLPLLLLFRLVAISCEKWTLFSQKSLSVRMTKNVLSSWGTSLGFCLPRKGTETKTVGGAYGLVDYLYSW